MKRRLCSTAPQSTPTAAKSTKLDDIYDSPPISILLSSDESSASASPLPQTLSEAADDLVEQDDSDDGSILVHVNVADVLAEHGDTAFDTSADDEQTKLLLHNSSGVQCEMGTECLRFCQAVDTENFGDFIAPEVTFAELDQTIATQLNHKPIPATTVPKLSSSNTRSWQFFETLIFLRTCIEHDVPAKMQEKNYKFSEVFHDVMLELRQQYGFERSTTQLKDKYKRLKSLYNRGEVAGIGMEIMECLMVLFGYAEKKNETTNGGT